MTEPTDQLKDAIVGGYVTADDLKAAVEDPTKIPNDPRYRAKLWHGVNMLEGAVSTMILDDRIQSIITYRDKLFGGQTKRQDVPTETIERYLQWIAGTLYGVAIPSLDSLPFPNISIRELLRAVEEITGIQLIWSFDNPHRKEEEYPHRKEEE